MSSRSAAGRGPGVHRQGSGAAAPPGAQPHGHVRHLLRGRLLLPLGPRHPRRHVRPLPAQPPGAGCPTQGAGAAVGGHRGAEPRAAGPPQCDGRDVWLLDGLLAVQPGGDAVDLASGLARAAGTVSLVQDWGKQVEGKVSFSMVRAPVHLFVFSFLVLCGGDNCDLTREDSSVFWQSAAAVIWYLSLKALE